MKVILFGATGMVGRGVLRECLRDPEVTEVLAVGRSTLGQTDPKLRELLRTDLMQFKDVEDQLRGFDACFFCLGVTSAGMSEADYRRVTHGVTASVATALFSLNPQMTFVFVSGAGADSTGKSRTMWARVKGEAENAVLGMGFRAAYVFRPGVIIPMHGIRSRTALYRWAYVVFGPLLPLMRKMFPGAITTTEQIGKAMLKLAKAGPGKRVLESRDIGAV